MQEQEEKAMAESENSAIATREAMRISERIFNHEERIFDFAVLRDLKIASADVEDNCEQLARQVQILRRFFHKIPCTRVGDELVPIGLPIFFSSHLKSSKFHLYQFDAWQYCFDEPFEMLEIDEAKFGFMRELQRFLKVRLDHFFPKTDAKQSWVLGGMNTQNASLTVEVHSVAIGARVLASPAYFQNFVVFGGPTSPATGYLSPGRYLFKVSMPLGQTAIDQDIFDIPPVLSPKLFV